MKERAQNLAVGITALLAIGLLAWILLLFGSAPRWMQDDYLITIELPQAGGLNGGSRVRMNGVIVGEVRSVRLVSPPGQGVIVRATLREDVRVPRAAKISVEAPLIGGSPTLDIQLDGLDAAAMADLLPLDDTATLTSHQVAGGLTDQLRQALDRPMAQLERVAVSIEQLSQQWTQVGANLNRLTERRSLDDVEQGLAEPNLSSVIARIDERIVDAERVLAELQRLVSDPRIGSTLERTQSAVDELGDAASSFGSAVEQLGTRYIALADELAAAVTSIKQAVERVDRGEGTLGKLMTDPSLYDNLNDTAQRLQLMLDEARLLIEKWKAEGVPIQF